MRMLKYLLSLIIIAILLIAGVNSGVSEANIHSLKKEDVTRRSVYSPTKKVTGLILKYYPKQRVVKVSIGRSDSVSKGMSLVAFRKTRFIVVRISEKVCYAKVVGHNRNGDVGVGKSVIALIPTKETPQAKIPKKGLVFRPNKQSPWLPQLTEWDSWWDHNKEIYFRNLPHCGGNLLKPSVQQFREIKPGLVNILNQTKQPLIISACLIALAKIGKNEDYQMALKKFITHKNAEVSDVAILACGIACLGPAIPDLAEVFKGTTKGE